MKILAIIPAYNEEKTIGEVIEKIKTEVPYMDILVINDGSKDLTSSIAREKGSMVIDLPLNSGIGTAVQTGYIFAKKENYEYAIQIDGDGQHEVKEVHRLINAIKERNMDMIIGSRYVRKNTAYKSLITRRTGIKFFSLIILFLTGEKIEDPTSGFRIINKKAIEFLADEYPADYPEPESLIWMHKKGLSFIEVPVTMNPRICGVSSINFGRAVYYMIKVTIAILIGAFKKIER